MQEISKYIAGSKFLPWSIDMNLYFRIFFLMDSIIELISHYAICHHKRNSLTGPANSKWAGSDFISKQTNSSQGGQCDIRELCLHDDVIKWKHFPRYWPFVRGIHPSPVNSPHKGHWRGALMSLLMCVWINGWVNNREAGDLRRYRAHYDVTVMWSTYVSNAFVSYCHFLQWMPSIF